MSFDPYGTTIFCDDIRHEVSGKLTLVGCYAGEMNIGEAPPFILPIFAALVSLRIPINKSFSSVKIRILQEEGDEVTEILAAEIEHDGEETLKTIKPEDTKDKVTSMMFPCQWSPLRMKKAGYLKVRAYLDDGEEILLGSLKINFSDEVSDD